MRLVDGVNEKDASDSFLCFVVLLVFKIYIAYVRKPENTAGANRGQGEAQGEDLYRHFVASAV